MEVLSLVLALMLLVDQQTPALLADSFVTGPGAGWSFGPTIL
jgi:hypothetical protein